MVVEICMLCGTNEREPGQVYCPECLNHLGAQPYPGADSVYQALVAWSENDPEAVMQWMTQVIPDPDAVGHLMAMKHKYEIGARS